MTTLVEPDVFTVNSARLAEVRLDDIVPDPDNERPGLAADGLVLLAGWGDLSLSEIDTEITRLGLTELVRSIAASGLQERVRLYESPPGATGRYTIVSGHRRVLAYRILAQESGNRAYGRIPALVEPAPTDPTERAIRRLVANMAREDIDPISLAEGVHALIARHSQSQSAVGRLLGKSQETIANLLRLLRLPVEVLDPIRRGALTLSHGLVLLTITHDEVTGAGGVIGRKLADQQRHFAERALTYHQSAASLRENVSYHVSQQQLAHQRHAAAQARQAEAVAQAQAQAAAAQAALDQARQLEAHAATLRAAGKTEVAQAVAADAAAARNRAAEATSERIVHEQTQQRLAAEAAKEIAAKQREQARLATRQTEADRLIDLTLAEGGHDPTLERLRVAAIAAVQNVDGYSEGRDQLRQRVEACCDVPTMVQLLARIGRATLSLDADRRALGGNRYGLTHWADQYYTLNAVLADGLLAAKLINARTHETLLATAAKPRPLPPACKRHPATCAACGTAFVVLTHDGYYHSTYAPCPACGVGYYQHSAVWVQAAAPDAPIYPTEESANAARFAFTLRQEETAHA